MSSVPRSEFVKQERQRLAEFADELVALIGSIADSLMAPISRLNNMDKEPLNLRDSIGTTHKEVITARERLNLLKLKASGLANIEVVGDEYFYADELVPLVRLYHFFQEHPDLERMLPATLQHDMMEMCWPNRALADLVSG